MSWMRAKQAKCTQYVAPSAVRLGQRWKVCSTQGVWLLVAVDVLHHHDGIVHQDADGEDQREQRDAVQCEAPHVFILTGTQDSTVVPGMLYIHVNLWHVFSQGLQHTVST